MYPSLSYPALLFDWLITLNLTLTRALVKCDNIILEQSAGSKSGLYVELDYKMPCLAPGGRDCSVGLCDTASNLEKVMEDASQVAKVMRDGAVVVMRVSCRQMRAITKSNRRSETKMRQESARILGVWLDHVEVMHLLTDKEHERTVIGVVRSQV